ncbi:hypothetical protein AGLY_016024, partial [Aphis glycines]
SVLEVYLSIQISSVDQFGHKELKFGAVLTSGLVSDGKVNTLVVNQKRITVNTWIFLPNVIYGHLKYSFLFSFYFINVENIFLAKSKYLKMYYKVPYELITKLTNHFRSESFFVYNVIHKAPDVQQSNTHLTTLFFFFHVQIFDSKPGKLYNLTMQVTPKSNKMNMEPKIISNFELLDLIFDCTHK